MSVKRIVANIYAADPSAAKAFYEDIFGLDILMDQGWIVTYGSSAETRPQLSVMWEGGSGAPVPDLSIEVDDFETVLEKVRTSGLAIEYGPVDEPWGVRRFFVRDPFGKLLNVLCHL